MIICSTYFFWGAPSEDHLNGKDDGKQQNHSRNDEYYADKTSTIHMCPCSF